MEWEHIRAHYARLVRESGLTQKQLAKAAGLSQNVISKLLHNRRDGPVVGTLLRAVIGLGLPLSSFFAQIEAMADADDDLARGLVAARRAKTPEIEHLELFRRFGAALHAFEQAFGQSTKPRPKRPPRRRVS
jgi:transcriptional regulator with XRE-family HTH domain